MPEKTILQHTFALERRYDTPVPEVFAAWSDPVIKARWFAGSVEHYELDFRPEGHETIRTTMDSGRRIVYDAVYRDIVADERLVCTATMAMDGILATLSTMAVTFAPDGDGTVLTVAEQDTFLDGHEQPSWREEGTASWLERLGAEVAGVR